VAVKRRKVHGRSTAISGCGSSEIGPGRDCSRAGEGAKKLPEEQNNSRKDAKARRNAKGKSFICFARLCGSAPLREIVVSLLQKTSTRHYSAIGVCGFGERQEQSRSGLAPEVIGRVLLWMIKRRLSLYLRFYTNRLIFNKLSALAGENPCLPPFIFKMFSALAFC